jgi:hypothetical protein
VRAKIVATVGRSSAVVECTADERTAKELTTAPTKQHVAISGQQTAVQHTADKKAANQLTATVKKAAAKKAAAVMKPTAAKQPSVVQHVKAAIVHKYEEAEPINPTVPKKTGPNGKRPKRRSKGKEIDDSTSTFSSSEDERDNIKAPSREQFLRDERMKEPTRKRPRASQGISTQQLTSFLAQLLRILTISTNIGDIQHHILESAHENFGISSLDITKIAKQSSKGSQSN